MEKTFVTIAEVGKLYGISRSTIIRRMNDGTLKAYKLGPRLVRFDAAEVAAALLGESA